MVPCELLPVLPYLKVSSSRTGSAGIARAAAEPVALTDMLRMAPRLLQSLCPKTLAALSSTSRQLRCMIHEHVTSISIKECNRLRYKRPAPRHQVTDLQVLTNGNWPRLQHLRICFDAKLELAAITALSRASWSSLTSLDLSHTCLGTDSHRGADHMSQLVLGKWPALKRLKLSYNQLETAAIALLTEADWPLEELTLNYNHIGVEAVGKLIQGRWPKLAHLDVKHSNLDAHAIAVLTEGQWPLRHLDLSYNELGTQRAAGSGAAPAESIGSLCEAAAWPQLVSLDLSGSWLRQADVAGLCTTHWPKLSMVNLEYNHLDKVSMMYLIKTDWPELRHLNLCKNHLDDAAVEVLSHHNWHKLERLGLSGQWIKLGQKAASFLSFEQQHVTVF